MLVFKSYLPSKTSKTKQKNFVRKCLMNTNNLEEFLTFCMEYIFKFKATIYQLYLRFESGSGVKWKVDYLFAVWWRVRNEQLSRSGESLKRISKKRREKFGSPKIPQILPCLSFWLCKREKSLTIRQSGSQSFQKLMKFWKFNLS